jgi:ubiquinone/menaquinone biosynthesis C-methylase UbiE
LKLSHPDDWTRYLRNHTLTSFGRIFPDNYDGAIRAFWQQQLTAEPVKHVVDICCGNGALCWIANEILNADVLTTQITGIDFADIDPFQVLNLDRS